MVSLEDSTENFILDNIEDYSVTSLQVKYLNRLMSYSSGSYSPGA